MSLAMQHHTLKKRSLFKSPAAKSLESPLFHSARMSSSIEYTITFPGFPGCSSITKITQTLLPYQECYHYIKVLNVWVCVWWKWEVQGVGLYSSTIVMRPSYLYYTVYCVSMITSGCTWGAGAAQLKWKQSGNSGWGRCSQRAAAEADAIWAQYGLTMQDITSACQRQYHARLMVSHSRGCARLTQMQWRRWNHRSITKRELSCAMLCYDLIGSPVHDHGSTKLY